MSWRTVDETEEALEVIIDRFRSALLIFDEVRTVADCCGLLRSAADYGLLWTAECGSFRRHSEHARSAPL